MNHTNRAAQSVPARAAHAVGAVREPPPSTAGEIKRIGVQGTDLEVGDVVLKMPHTGVHEYRLLHIVRRNGAYLTAQCIDDLHPDVPATLQTFGSVNTLETVVAGPKVEAARKDPSLLIHGSPNKVWKSQRKEAATT